MTITLVLSSSVITTLLSNGSTEESGRATGGTEFALSNRRQAAMRLKGREVQKLVMMR